VPCAPILDRSSLLGHPQIEANAIVESHEEKELGTYRLPRPAARFSKTQSEQRIAAPHLGQHTKELLVELGYDEGTIANLVGEGAVSAYVG
jgi:crotonobetainyl-CoA:carnitine CoA-transferase CaiB-like acyl-CoA transferase